MWDQSNWDIVLSSDETHFQLNTTKKDRVIRRRGRNQRNRLNKTKLKKPKQQVSLSFWAMVAYNYKSPLVLIPRHLTQETYLELILKLIVGPFFIEKRRHNDLRWWF